MTVLRRGTGGTLVLLDRVVGSYQLKEDREGALVASPETLARNPNGWYQEWELQGWRLHTVRTLVLRGATAYQLEGTTIFVVTQNRA